VPAQMMKDLPLFQDAQPDSATDEEHALQRSEPWTCITMHRVTQTEGTMNCWTSFMVDSLRQDNPGSDTQNLSPCLLT
jgi:hypothetical protein